MDSYSSLLDFNPTKPKREKEKNTKTETPSRKNEVRSIEVLAIFVVKGFSFSDFLLREREENGSWSSSVVMSWPLHRCSYIIFF
jgi:hypothetical protein